MRFRIVAVVVTLTLGILSTSFTAEAQQAGKVWRIGLFHVGLDHVPPSLEPLREGLKALGYEQGKNLHLDWRNLPDEDAARETAKEFVRNRVDLIVAFENQTARASKAATSEIPVVFLHTTDPVADGFAKSLARPGGNLTGFAGLPDLTSKRLELFKELIPRLRRVLLLIDPQDPATKRLLEEARRDAVALKLHLVEREATTQSDIERVFASVKRGDVDGVFVLSPNLYSNFSTLTIRRTAERRLPQPAHRKEWVEKGALFSYSPDLASVGTLAARYVDRILKGAKPADLPVEELSKFEFVINLKVAKALGLTIPAAVLNRADKVIQ